MARADRLLTPLALALATLVVCAAQTPLDVFTTAMNDMANTLEANAAALLAGVLPGATMTGSPVTNGVQVCANGGPGGTSRRALSPNLNSHHVFLCACAASAQFRSSKVRLRMAQAQCRVCLPCFNDVVRM